MALVNIKQCDVYGTFLGVEQYEIVMRRIGDLDGVPVRTWKPYLCKRALNRALRFIDRAATEPPKKPRQ